MKRYLSPPLIATALLAIVVMARASGIPVVDVAGNLQEMNHWLEKVSQ